MLTIFSRLADAFLFNERTDAAGRPLRMFIRFLRFPYAILRDVISGDLTLRAMSLVYTTMLSIVPLLAFSFSVLKGFGIHRQIEQPLLKFFEPLGQRGIELSNSIISFVDNVQGTILGTFGLIFLIYTVISMIQKVEDSFNYVWQVERPRSFARRFTEYVSVLLIGPVLMFTAIGLLASLESTTLVQRLSEIEPFGTTLFYISRYAPFVLVIFVFSFVYTFVPNTRVKLSAALVGGTTAGIIWATIGKLFAALVAASTKYTAIYSGFAIVVMALMWLYISWLILLLGAQIAFYYQNPEFLRSGRRRVELAGLLREKLALSTMYLLAAAYYEGRNEWTLNKLASHFGVPANAFGSVTSALEKRGLIVATENEQLMPGRALDTILLTDVLAAVRDSTAEAPQRTGVAVVDKLAGEIESAIADKLGKKTLRDVVDTHAVTTA